MRICSWRFWTLNGSALFWLLASYPVKAEIASDTTLPVNSVVTTPSGNTWNITQGTQAGGNLFHSFREFSVPTGGKAFFDNGVDIQNIITRVTGGSTSNIDGIIQANGAANLFFINPSGIFFGPNASLNIGGSFVASTANSLRFADGIEFSATNPQTTPLLTVSVPVGLQFGSNPGRIVNQSQASPNGALNNANPSDPVGLQVPSGKTLALVGGNISLESGNLTAAGEITTESGRIEIGSVGAGLVNLTQIPQGYILGYSGVQNFQDIELSGGAQINASGQSGGNIQIKGRNINLRGDANEIFSITLGEGTGGTLTVEATESVNLSGNDTTLFTESSGSGSAANLTITTRKLTVKSGAYISTFSNSEDQAGDLLVRASDAVELSGTNTDGQPSGLFTQVSTGKSGNLTLETGKLTIRGGAAVDASTFGTAQAGNVRVRATDIELLGTGPRSPSGIFAQVAAEDAIENAGDAGTLTIDTQRLTVLGGAQISTAGRKGGNGGDLTINASDSIRLSGALSETRSSGIFVSAEPGARGNVGNLNITTRLLTIENGARISADNLGTGLGPAGNLTITANDIRLNGGSLSARTNAGDGANIRLQNVDLLLMQNQSRISAAASGNANGGNINIDAPNGFVVAVSGQNNDIIASAIGGEGGNINITASSIFGIEEREQTSLTNDINASSEFGLPGTVIINRPEVEPVEGLLELPVAVVDASGLIDTGCAAFANSEGSTFFVTGLGGLPPSPEESLSTDVLWSDTRISKTTAQRSQTVTTKPAAVTNIAAIVPATGWVFNNKGEVTLISHASGTTGMASTPATCSKQ